MNVLVHKIGALRSVIFIDMDLPYIQKNLLSRIRTHRFQYTLSCSEERESIVWGIPVDQYLVVNWFLFLLRKPLVHRTATTGKRKLNTTETNKILLCNNLSVTDHEHYYNTFNCVNNYGTPKNLWQPKTKHLPKVFHNIPLLS